jgi:hypothetical protein
VVNQESHANILILSSNHLRLMMIKVVLTKHLVSLLVMCSVPEVEVAVVVVIDQ